MVESFDVDGNRLALLTEGPARLDALIALIDAASRDLKLLYYTYAEDPAGQRVHNALLAAAARGVSIALIVDGFGSDADAHKAFFAPLRAAGIDLCSFHPRWGRRYLLRNHQKMAIADNDRAIIGGFNLAADYFDTDPAKAWRDLGLTINGPAAKNLAGYFATLQGWTKQPQGRMRDLRRALRRWSNPSGAVRWLLGGPVRRLSPWASSVRADMRTARRMSLIAAYFAPNPAMLRRLDRIGESGEACIVTAAKSDNVTTIGAARFTYPGLLRKGVRVFEYAPSKLHTKLILIDDIVYIGSANFDVRSLYLNLEVMLRIKDKAFAAHVARYIGGEIANSAEQSLRDYSGWRTLPARLQRALAYFIVTVLDYSVTRRLNIGAR